MNLRVSTVALALAFLTASVSADPVSLRIRFGMKDKQPTDWSGKLDVQGVGKVQSIRGWRWTAGDSADGNAFTVATRRPQAQNAAEKARVDAGQKLPLNENGIIVTLADTTPGTQIKFESKPGSHAFKLADVPYGKTISELDDNLRIERVPAAGEFAGSIQDEDYPAIATGKDGTTYVAYVVFTHGKSFQGARERLATAESGPVAGPLATGKVKKIEKPEDLDYLAEPAGGDQVFLRSMGKDGTWGDPIAVTDGKTEVYRPAIAVDGRGKVWVFYSAHVGADKNLDYGNWELMARSFGADGIDASEPVNVSNAAGADFMPAAACDSKGSVCVTWVGGRESHFNVFVSQQTADGAKFSAPARVGAGEANEWEPAIAADDAGNVAVAYDTYAKGDYDVYVARRNSSGDGFEKAQPVAATLAFEVRPSLAYDKSGKLWVAYELSGDQWGKDFGALKKAGIPLYQSGRSVAVRAMDRDGKWSSPPDVMDAVPQNAGAVARPRAAARGKLQPTGASGWIAPCFPRIATAGDGHVWLAFRGRPGGNWRVPVGSVWFEYVTKLGADSWEQPVWVPRSSNILDNRPAILATGDDLKIVYSGDGRGENNPAKVDDPHFDGKAEAEFENPAGAGPAGANDDDVVAITAADKEPAPSADELLKSAPGGKKKQRAGRGGGAGRGAGTVNINCDLFVTTLRASDFESGGKGIAKLEPTEPAVVVGVPQVAEAERNAIKAMHEYRVNLNGETLKIWRGEFHRHTEFSPDGGNDGGLLDMWRYAVDAANLDWIGDGDHDYGSGREYSWWTTQKAVTLFTLPNTFVPMYSYERSVSYPEGHRNCLFAQRGVRSLPRLPISDPEKFAPAPDTNLLYVYLKHFNGLCSPHTSATNMGTDWRNYDAEVEPFVEIYQGDRNNYERPDSPRSAVTEAKLKQSTPEKESLGGWQPKGFVNLALLNGRRYAFQCSSDHISTHLSYCNVLVTEPTRQGVMDAIRKKRVYGATDNIIADVRCKVSGSDKSVEHFMGESFSTSEAPTLDIHIVGCRPLAKVTIIKDDQEVHVATPNQQDVRMSWTDPKPTVGKTSYYYVRGEQVPDGEGYSAGELVWASPMWITYEPK